VTSPEKGLATSVKAGYESENYQNTQHLAAGSTVRGAGL